MKMILNEDAESRSQKKAIRFVVDNTAYDKEGAEDYVRNKLRKTYKILQGNRKLGKFTFGIVRLVFENVTSLSNREFIGTLLSVINLDEDIQKELDDNFNGMSLEELKYKYRKQIHYYINQREEEELSDLSNAGRDNDYRIVRINSFDDAKRFEPYVNWCICSDSDMYYEYTDGDTNIFYFLLRDGYTEEDVNDYQYPTNDDAYALSMIAVSINKKTKEIVTCNTRRNRELVGHDHQLDWVEISKLIGSNIKTMIMEYEANNYNSTKFNYYLKHHKDDDIFEFTDKVRPTDIRPILKMINDEFYKFEVINDMEEHENLISLVKGKYFAFSQTVMNIIGRNPNYYDLMAETIEHYYYKKILNVVNHIRKVLVRRGWDSDYNFELGGDTNYWITRIDLTVELDSGNYYQEEDNEYNDGTDGIDYDMYESDCEYVEEMINKVWKNTSDNVDETDVEEGYYVLTLTNEKDGKLNCAESLKELIKIAEMIKKS